MKRTNKSFDSDDRKTVVEPYMDNPEGVKTDKESLFDMHEDMQNVDPIPIEDVRMEWQEEQPGNRHKTKNQSSSEEKYKGR